MKLGILNACTPQDEEEFELKEFQSFTDFLGLVDHNFTLVEYRITEDEFPRHATECDAYLITGSPKGVYDHVGWIGQLGDFIRDSYTEGVKLVGICFGHQILAHALGGHAEKSQKGWGMGPNVVEVSQRKPWMKPALPDGSFYFCHQDQVMTLPPEAELLAGNEFCQNGMFVIGDQVLGLQAHPEFTTDVMERAIVLLQAETNDGVSEKAAAATAECAVDNPVMAQWIVNFLVGASPLEPKTSVK